MKIKEVNMNIMCVPQGYSLVGAFSSDLNCSVGVPAVFNKMFNITERVDVDLEPGMVFKLDNLYILTVKESSYDAPNMTMLRNALEKLRKAIVVSGVRKIAMPKICTGKNGFDWKDVYELITDVFEVNPVDILVCCQ